MSNQLHFNNINRRSSHKVEYNRYERNDCNSLYTQESTQGTGSINIGRGSRMATSKAHKTKVDQGSIPFAKAKTVDALVVMKARWARVPRNFSTAMTADGEKGPLIQTRGGRETVWFTK
jgi:hypothetical protein